MVLNHQIGVRFPVPLPFQKPKSQAPSPKAFGSLVHVRIRPALRFSKCLWVKLQDPNPKARRTLVGYDPEGHVPTHPIALSPVDVEVVQVVAFPPPSVSPVG